jgi:hypothetical protein
MGRVNSPLERTAGRRIAVRYHHLLCFRVLLPRVQPFSFPLENGWMVNDQPISSLPLYIYKIVFTIDRFPFAVF